MLSAIRNQSQLYCDDDDAKEDRKSLQTRLANEQPGFKEILVNTGPIRLHGSKPQQSWKYLELYVTRVLDQPTLSYTAD